RKQQQVYTKRKLIFSARRHSFKLRGWMRPPQDRGRISCPAFPTGTDLFAGVALLAHKPRVYRTNSWRNPLLRGELNLPPLIALLEILLCTYLLHVFEGFKGVYDGFPGERIATVPLLPVPPAEKLHRPEDAQRLFQGVFLHHAPLFPDTVNSNLFCRRLHQSFIHPLLLAIRRGGLSSRRLDSPCP